MKKILLISVFSSLVFAGQCEDQIQRYKELVSTQDTIIEKAINQRNKAYEQSKDFQPSIPWWVYTIVGAAGATVLIRGVK